MSSLSNFSFSEFYQTSSLQSNPQLFNNQEKTLKNYNQKSNLFDYTINNSSRFQQKKVLQKLKQQNVLKRIQETFSNFEQNDKKLKKWLDFKPIKAQKSKTFKQNINNK